jgi:hypothetical protein
LASIAAVGIGLPEPLRVPLSYEAQQSVDQQTRRVDDFVFGQDYSRRGEVWNMNRLLRGVDCDWVAFIHDDDLWLPEHLAVCEKHFDDADVVVSRFDLVGRPWHTIEPWHDNFEDLRFTNWIGSPSMVVARREVFGEWVGLRGKFCWNDWSQWNHLLDNGARFVDTRTVTVKYRFGNWSNGSWRS